ncbi:MAG TPA: hypothetical protein VIZ30_12155 [Pseudomonadales bacterium]
MDFYPQGLGTMALARLSTWVGVACWTLGSSAVLISADAGMADQALQVPVQSNAVVPTTRDLRQRLVRLQSEAEAVQDVLATPGGGASSTLQLTALVELARSVAAETRSDARLRVADKAAKLDADADAIERGMEEARTKAETARKAAYLEMVAGIIGAAIQIQGAIQAMESASGVSSKDCAYRYQSIQDAFARSSNSVVTSYAKAIRGVASPQDKERLARDRDAALAELGAQRAKALQDLQIQCRSRP